MKFTEQLAALSLFISTASAECLVGQYLDGSTCTACSAGTYANTTTATTCTACPTTTYSGTSAEECTDCATGTTQFDLSTSNVDSDSCLTGCSAGYGYTSSGCSVCSAGEFTNNVTMTNVNVEGCFSCPTGEYSDGVTPSSSCLMCAAGYGTESCSECRTGTTSTAALKAVAECSMCTDDANGCYGHGTCATDTGVCTCDSGWTGTFCGEFDTSVVATATSVTAVEVDTGTDWNDDYADSTSDAYTTLQTSVSDAATSTFEASASAGYVLKSVFVTLGQSEDTTKDSFENKVGCGKRARSSVPLKIGCYDRF